MVPLLNFQLDFVLPVPRYWFNSAFTDNGWIYLAGGAGTDGINVNAFQKIDVVNGVVIELPNLRSPCLNCILIKF